MDLLKIFNQEGLWGQCMVLCGGQVLVHGGNKVSLRRDDSADYCIKVKYLCCMTIRYQGQNQWM